MDRENEHKPKALIEILDNGPMRITGNFIVKDVKRGREESPCEILLCRCGRSKNKPYCDDSHLK